MGWGETEAPGAGLSPTEDSGGTGAVVRVWLVAHMDVSKTEVVVTRCQTQGEALPECTHKSSPRQHGLVRSERAHAVLGGLLPSRDSEAECHS